MGPSADVLVEEVAEEAGDVLVASPAAQAVSERARAVVIRVTVLTRALTTGLSPSDDGLLPMLRRNDSDSVSGAG